MISALCDRDQHGACHVGGCLCGCHLIAAAGMADYFNRVPMVAVMDRPDFEIRAES